MSFYTITSPSDIFTLIVNVYGTLEESILFVSDNSALISSLSANISTLAGEPVYYNAALVVTLLSPKTVLATPPAPVTQFTWLGREGQNMFDVCIQTYGILDSQIKLLNDNNLVLTSPVYGQQFSYNSTLIANSSSWNRSTGIGIVFSTGSPIVGGSFDESFEFLSYENTTDVNT
jgi:hypothetical protein